ncbi:gliding motility-associated C-terminal domain-containing protein [Chitinophaga barathri]|nr:gliding motility-associated C-terminal domain-containing protein [Chitinophaga barathri]
MKELYAKLASLALLICLYVPAFSQNQMEHAPVNPFTMTMATPGQGRMITGDFDNDGDVDILYQNGNAIGAGFGYVRNNGGGSWQDFPTAAAAGTPFNGFDFSNENLAPAGHFVFDYDNDGDMDILDRDIDGVGASLWRNENGASFTKLATPFTVPGWTLALGRMIVGDFDNDGDKDILYQVGGTAGTGIGFLRNNGSGAFTNVSPASSAGTPFSSFDFTGQQVSALTVLDYDMDGDVDIIDRDLTTSMGVWRNNAGSFVFETGPFTFLPMTLGLNRLVFGDFDVDGDPDMLYQNGSVAGAGFGYARNDGAGAYTHFATANASPGEPFNGFDFTNEQMSALFVFDYDTDGDVDIVDRDPTGSSLGVWRQAGTPPRITATSPADNATGVAKNTNIDLTFSEAVTKNTGNIYIVNTATNVTVMTIDVNSAAVTSVSTTVWRINPPADLAVSTTYAIRMDMGVFKDVDDMVTPAVSNNTTYNFTTLTPVPPTITNLNGDAVSYTEATAPVKLDVGLNATANDDQASFNGGSLNIAFTTNAVNGQDLLAIENQGSGPGQIAVSAGNVLYENVVIGTVTGGTAPNAMLISFNSATATPAAVTALIRALQYSNNSNNANGNTRTLTLTLTDSDGATATAAVTAALIRVNDIPGLTIPATVTVKEDVPTAINNISFTDADGGGLPAGVTLTVPSGTFAAAVFAGVVITGNNTGTLVLNGTSTVLNTYLATAGSITFAFPANQSFNQNITVTVSDLGNTGTPGAQTITGTIGIIGQAVNDGPSITAPASFGAAEDVQSAITGFSFADIDAGASPVTVSLSLPFVSTILAATSSGGVIVTVIDQQNIQLNGTVADINAFVAANNVLFTPAPNVTTNVPITITINDGGNTGEDPGLTGTPTSEEATVTAPIVVAPANDLPTIAAPASYTVAEDNPLTINGIIFSDVDNGTSNLNKATFTLTGGTLSATGTPQVTVTGSGTNTLALQGTRADINAFVAANSITAAFPAGYLGAASVIIEFDDAGDVGGGPLVANAGPININITAVNDAPAITAPASITSTEDQSTALSGISFSDTDAGTSTVRATFSVTSGTLNATSGGGVIVTQLTPQSVQLDGSITAINSFVGNVSFQNAPNSTANVTLNITINDNGNTGADPGTSGDATSEEATTAVTITITAANDAPTVATPASFTTAEDVTLALTGIIFSDSDAGTSVLTKATLVVTQGMLNATSGAGVTVTGSGTATLELQGTMANINAFIAASGVSFVPAANFSGIGTLNITFNDAGDTGSGGAQTGTAGPVNITVTAVNDGPAIAAPASIAAAEDQSTTLSGITLADVDAGTSAVEATFSVTSGTLSAASGGGVTVTQPTPQSVQLVGSITAINSFIGNVSFQNALNSTANVTLNITINDNGNTGVDPGTSGDATSEEATTAVTITITAANDAPTVATPASFTTAEDVTLALTGIIFSDSDAGTSVLTKATLVVTQGILNATSGAGVTVTGSGTATLELQGTMVNINAFIAASGVSFVPAANFAGTGTLNITFDDAGDTGSGGAKIGTAGPINITVTAVNDGPVITTPASIAAVEDQITALTGISFADADAGTSQVTVTFSVASGALTAASGGGVAVTQLTPQSVRLTGSVVAINSSMNNVVFLNLPDNTANVALSITVNDGGNTGADPGTSGDATSEEASATVTIIVAPANDAPAITTPFDYTTAEDVTLALTGIIFSDPDAGTSALTKATLVVTQGVLNATSGAGVTVTGNGTATVELQGTMVNINNFIAAGSVAYVPAADFTGTATLNVSFDDAGDTGTGGPQTASEGPVNINVTAVNDGPAISAPASINITEDQATALSGISFSDTDAGTSPVSVIFAVSTGTVSAASGSGVTVTQINPQAVQLDGTVTAINSFIGNVIFQNEANNTANVQMVILINDDGNTGADPGTTGTPTSEQATATVTLQIVAVNDAPVIAVPGTQTTLMNISKVFSTGNGNLISISDTDAGTNPVKVELTASLGTLTLSGITGLVFSVGDGTGDATMTFTGTLTNINAALSGLTLVPPTNHTGNIVITIHADDQGNTPAPAQTDTKTIIVGVQPITPTITGVTSTAADGIYKTGDVLSLTISFTQPVTVTGTPQLLLETGTADALANYTSGSGTTTLTFNYQVQSGNVSPDLDYTAATALTLNGGTIRNTGAMDADLTLPAPGAANSLGANKALVIDGIAPVVTAVNLPANGTYVAGQQMDFMVTFSEVVAVTGTPSLGVTLQGGAVPANYISGSGSNTLVFRYTVVAGDLDNDGIAPGSLALNGGTVRDVAGNDAVLQLQNMPSASAILVDAVVPVITGVTLPQDKIWKEGEVLDFIILFSEPVTKAGAPNPAVGLTVGATVKQLSNISGTGTNSLTFRYTVAAGDLDRNGVTLAAALALNGATLRDAAGNDALLAVNNAGDLSNIRVDAVPPVVTAGQVFTVAENSAAGTAVGTIAGTDPGSTGTLQQWAITTNINPDGDANQAFSINAATGVLTVNDAGDMNFEDQPTLIISVTVSDGVNTSAVQTVTVNVTDRPEPPLDITLSSASILENNAPNAQVGILSSTSTEPGATFTYSMAAGGADNAAFAITGNVLQAIPVLDAETKATYSIKIRSTTQAGEFLEKDFTITVTDVNEAPTLGAITDRQFCATNADQLIGLTGITAGPESGQTLTVTVASDNNALFAVLAVDNSDLRVRFAPGANGSANVTVTVKDNGGTANGGTDQATRTFRINVTSIAAPTIVSDKGLNVSKGDVVMLTASGGVTYVWDNAPGIISGQNSATLTIRPQQNAVYRVTASNAAGCSASAQVSIEVKEDYKVNSANILTPNGDGKNDRFIIQNIDSYPNNELKIFDQSGRLIYTKKGYQNEWDGRVNGKPLEEGTVYFLLDFGPGLPKVKGYITIIRDKR